MIKQEDDTKKYYFDTIIDNNEIYEDEYYLEKQVTGYYERTDYDIDDEGNKKIRKSIFLTNDDEFSVASKEVFMGIFDNTILDDSKFVKVSPHKYATSKEYSKDIEKFLLDSFDEDMELIDYSSIVIEIKEDLICCSLYLSYINFDELVNFEFQQVFYDFNFTKIVIPEE